MPDDYTGLLTGSHWSGIEVYGKSTIVTYSFPVAANGYVAQIDDPALTPSALASWARFGAAEAQLARDALAAWGDVSGLIFIEVAPGQGDINFQKLDFSGTGYDGAGGIAYRPFGDWSFDSYPSFTGNLDASGDVFMNSDFSVDYGTLVHEVGHALGLKHPTEVWTQWAAQPPVVHAVWSADDPAATVMSQNTTRTTLGTDDLQAIRHIYGTQEQDGTQVQAWSWNAGTQTLTQSGFSGGDVIRGVSVRDVIRGADGFDRLYGLAGNDTMYGGLGDDSLDGGAGIDRMEGGQGDDTYYVSGASDRVIEKVNAGWDVVNSQVGLTLPDHVEQVNLYTTGKAMATGNALSNVIFGGTGANTITGLEGDDYLVGGAARDTITGGAGSDLMFGGAAADRFVFVDMADFGPAGLPDTIGDFSRAEGDRILLAAIDPDGGLAGDQGFSFIGLASFTSDSRYQLRYVVDGGNATVEIDIDHDMVADATLLLYGVTHLRALDFLL